MLLRRCFGIDGLSEGSAVFNFLKVRIILMGLLHLESLLTMLSVALPLYCSLICNGGVVAASWPGDGDGIGSVGATILLMVSEITGL